MEENIMDIDVIIIYLNFINFNNLRNVKWNMKNSDR